jgi:ribonucleotide reductase alpha subunit
MKAKKLNQKIFKTMYFAAVTASMEMAKKGPLFNFKVHQFLKNSKYNLWVLQDSDFQVVGIGPAQERSNGIWVRNSLW